MSERPSSPARDLSRDARPQDSSFPSGPRAGVGPRPRMLWDAVLPVVTVTLIGAIVAVFLTTWSAGAGATTTWTVLGVAAAVSLGMIAFAVLRTVSSSRTIDEDVAAMAAATTARAQADIQHTVDQLCHEIRSASPGRHGAESGHSAAFAAQLEQLRQAVSEAGAQSAALTPGTGLDQRVGVFVNLSRRLQSLVHREIQLLDDLEAQVEDPDLLKGLFAVDHLATRIRRHAENLSVLGGAVPRRQWSRPVNIYVVLRSAVAEVEHYSRVKLVRPLEGTLQGHAIADVIHLVAELVENATKFSSPNTQVLLRAQAVTAGVAIEIEDRGLGMPREDQGRLNSMLSSPDQVNLDELLNDGRIGLFVVSTLARRHGIAVQLQTNIFGGTQAVIVLPNGLLGDNQPSSAPPRHQTKQLEQRVPDRPTPAHAESRPAADRVESETAQSPTVAARPAPAAAPMAQRTRKPMPFAGGDESTWPSAGESLGGAERPRTGSLTPTMRSANQPAPSPDQSAPMHSAPEPSAAVHQSAPQAAQHMPSQSADLDYGAHSETAHESDQDDRPRLPQRRKQTHLAPQLRDMPPEDNEKDAVSDTGHDPGLVMAFKQGRNRADAVSEEHDGRTDSAN